MREVMTWILGTLIVLFGLVMLYGCGTAPTMPTLTGPSPVAAAMHAGAQVADGCTPAIPMPAMLAEMPDTSRALMPGEMHYTPGAVLAEWMQDDGRTLWAVLHGDRVCVWDRAGL